MNKIGSVGLAIILCLFLCVVPDHSSAFGLSTHGVLADKAYDLSSLGRSSSLLSRLGLVDLPEPLGITYYDFNSFQVSSRKRYLFEKDLMPRLGDDSSRIRGWLMRGAIREDDGGYNTALAKLSVAEPLDDPFGNFNRFCNHFFDPVGVRGLEPATSDFTTPILCGASNRRRAPDWAIGAVDAFAASPQAAADYRNHFTIFTAREAMWRALTLREQSGAPAGRSNGDSDEQIRKAYWATTFRTLGDVAHLIQDMAQPQHTRNEAHGTGHVALFEEYLDARAKEISAEFRFDNETLTAEQVTPLRISAATIANYPPPTFNRYSDYWSTAPGAASITSAGKGLADYSSRGFLTPGKNVDDSANDFVLPIRNSSAYQTFTSLPPSTEDCSPGGSLRRVKYLLGTVPDSITGAADPVRMASAGVLDGKYSINRCVMDDRANLLLSRAAGYSAGLIDYFFRGQMEITPPDEGVYSLIDHFDFSGEGKTPTDAAAGFKGFKTIKLKLRNITPDITPSGGGAVAPQIMTGGTLVAVLKFYRNLSYTDNLAGDPTGNTATAFAQYRAGRSAVEEIVVSSSVKDGNGNPLTAPIPVSNTAQTYIFEFSQELPINATDVKLQVVYRGVLGSEADAVVVQTVDISEPSYFAYMNATDYIKIGTSVYTRDEINAATSDGATLRSKIRPATCIDPSTNQLVDSISCMQARPINFPLYWNTSAPGQIGTFALDNVRTYHRIATLNPPAGSADYYLAASTCLPNDPISVPGRIAQTDYVPDPMGSGGYIPTANVTFSPFATRGVNGWYTVACINNGDGSVPGQGTDDRITKMTALTGTNLKPLQVLQFKFGAP